MLITAAVQDGDLLVEVLKVVRIVFFEAKCVPNESCVAIRKPMRTLSQETVEGSHESRWVSAVAASYHAVGFLGKIRLNIKNHLLGEMFVSYRCRLTLTAEVKSDTIVGHNCVIPNVFPSSSLIKHGFDHSVGDVDTKFIFSSSSMLLWIFWEVSDIWCFLVPTNAKLVLHQLCLKWRSGWLQLNLYLWPPWVATLRCSHLSTCFRSQP